MLSIFRPPPKRNEEPKPGNNPFPPGPQPPPIETAVRTPIPPPESKPPIIIKPPELTTSVQQTTMIGKGLTFKGEVTGKGSVRIEGQFFGTLDIGNEAIIGEGGIVEGNIRSKVVSVLGVLKGNVIAQEKIHIDTSGSMIGDIVAPRVIVAEGAVYKGRIDMDPKTLEEAKVTSVGVSTSPSDKKQSVPKRPSEPASGSGQSTAPPGPPPRA